MSYYDRAGTTHVDGTPIFATAEDHAHQTDTAAALCRAWKCELHEFGTLSAIDYYAVRNGRLVGVVEIKARSHATTTYPTAFLNVRKWLALCLAEAGLGCPAIYVVRFTDETRWIPVRDIDATRHRIGGCRDIVKAKSDVGPVIDVPVEQMRRL